MSRHPIYDVLERQRHESDRDGRWEIVLAICTALITVTYIGLVIHALVSAG
jgi:hypothetical protein